MTASSTASHFEQIIFLPWSYSGIDHANILCLKPYLQTKIGIDDRLSSKIISTRHDGFVINGIIKHQKVFLQQKKLGRYEMKMIQYDK